VQKVSWNKNEHALIGTKLWKNTMIKNQFLPVVRTLALIVAASFFAQFSNAQLEPASPPIADPADTRFRNVREDWTSPSLSKSHLISVTPLVGQTAKYDGYTVDLVRVQWRWGDPIDLYIIKPNGVTKPPVILYLNGYPSDTDIFMNEAYQKMATKDGFAAVGFVSALTGHRYHDRPMRKWFLSELQESLATSAHDVQMILDYLDTRGDLDIDRVGMFAQLSGAGIGILASSADPRIKVLDVLDPWGDWPIWMESSPFVPREERADYVKPDYLDKVASLDTLQWLPRIQAKKFRFQQRSYELETPPAAKDKLLASVPANTTVVVYRTKDEFLKAVGEDGNKDVDWLRHELSALPGAATNKAVATKGSAVPHSK
jgi:hypothetical protein